MLLRITASLYFCLGWWLPLSSEELSTNPQSSFQVFEGTKITSGQSENVRTRKTLLECFVQCILDSLCLGLTLRNYTNIYPGFYHVADCDSLHMEYASELTLSLDSQVTTVVKLSFIQDSFQTRKFSKVMSSSFTISKIVTIPNGQGEEYCFLHCALLGSSCQGLQIEKSCHTKETMYCQVIDLPSASTAVSLQPNCSSDIYLKESGN